jgi:hypothetical protein
MKRWLISVAAAVAITAGSTLAAGPATAAAPGSASAHQVTASAHHGTAVAQQGTAVAAKDFCSGRPPKKKTPSRPFNNLDWMRFGYLLVAAPSKESDLCPILA